MRVKDPEPERSRWSGAPLLLVRTSFEAPFIAHGTVPRTVTKPSKGEAMVVALRRTGLDATAENDAPRISLRSSNGIVRIRESAP
jgi:hypothetical protein